MAFSIKINKNILSFLALFIFSMQFIAQELPSYWQVDYGVGSIIKHKKVIGHLVTAHPEILTVSWHNNAAPNSIWKERYNYLDWGIALYYQKFNNPILGDVVALQYQTTFYLLNRNSKNQLNFLFGTGLGYNTNPLNLENNNQNVAMSSNIQLAELFKLEYKRPYLIKNFGFHAGFLLSHFSNASFKNPNFGINTLFINAGLEYHLSENPINYSRIEKLEKIEKQPYHIIISVFSGVHEAHAGLGTKPVYALSGQISKKIGYKSGLLLGVDFFNSQAVKEFADFRFHTLIEFPDRKLIDHKQMGIFAGHELFFNKISFETILGYYIYNPLKVNPSVYQKFSLKYHLNKSIAVSTNLKVHNFRAEYFTLGLHYQIH
jgi:hypothetical protein